MSDFLEHGTRAFHLTPSSIKAAAERDLRRRDENEAPPYQQYAFHRKHVRKGETVRDILDLATKEPAFGQTSGKRCTRLIYGDVTLLQAALALCEAGMATETIMANSSISNECVASDGEPR